MLYEYGDIIISRLVTFGDSYTQGIGLTADMNGHFITHCSPIAWPKLTADKLHIGCTNMGQSGVGCKTIAHKILKFEFTPKDYVVIMWPNKHRYSIILDPDHKDYNDVWSPGIINIAPTDVDNCQEARSYYENLYSESDSDFMSKAWITLSNTFLASRVSRVINTVSNSHGLMSEYQTMCPEFEWISGFKDTESELLDYAPDGHWGVKAHENFSIKLSRYISST